MAGEQLGEHFLFAGEHFYLYVYNCCRLPITINNI